MNNFFGAGNMVAAAKSIMSKEANPGSRKDTKKKVKLRGNSPANDVKKAPAETSGEGQSTTGLKAKVMGTMAAAKQMFDKARGRSADLDATKDGFSEASTDSFRTDDTESLSRSSSMSSVEGNTEEKTSQRSETQLDTKEIKEFENAWQDTQSKFLDDALGDGDQGASLAAQKALKEAANEALPTILEAVQKGLGDAFKRLGSNKKRKILKKALAVQTSNLEGANEGDKPEEIKLLSLLSKLVDAATENKGLKKKAQAAGRVYGREQSAMLNEQSKAQEEPKSESQEKQTAPEPQAEPRWAGTRGGIGRKSEAPKETFQPQTKTPSSPGGVGLQRSDGYVWPEGGELDSKEAPAMPEGLEKMDANTSHSEGKQASLVSESPAQSKVEDSEQAHVKGNRQERRQKRAALIRNASFSLERADKYGEVTPEDFKAVTALGRAALE